MTTKEPPASHVLKRGQRQKAQEEQEDTRRGKRTEPARLHPQRAPDSKRLTQNKRTPRRVGGLGLGHWRCTGPRLPDHQSERARAVSKSPAGRAAEGAGPSGRSEPRRDKSSLPRGCGILRPKPSLREPRKGRARTVMWKRVGFTESGSLTLLYVCPQCGLFRTKEFIGWFTEEHGEKSQQKEAVQLEVCCVWWAVRLDGGTHDATKQQDGALSCLQSACSTHGTT